MILTFIILGLTIGLLLLNRLPMEVVALLSMLALFLFGLITPAQAMAGFGNPTVITIAALFVVGGGLFHTGVADWLAMRLIRLAGESETRLKVVVVLLTALFSAFMSSTGTVAVLLPAVVAAAKRIHLSPSRLLLPLAFAAQIGGLLTLVGTPPNIVLANTLKAQNLTPFGFFEFTLIGLPILLAYLLYLIIFRSKTKAGDAMNPADERRQNLDYNELRTSYQLTDKLFRLRVRHGSPLIGKSLIEADLTNRYGVQVLHIVPADRTQGRNGHHLFRMLHAGETPIQPAQPHMSITPQCQLVVSGDPKQMEQLAIEQQMGLQAGPPSADEANHLLQEYGLAEILLTPRSALVGKTIADDHFSSKHGVRVLGILRNGKPLAMPFIKEKLAFGDALLVYGRWSDIQLMKTDNRNFIIVGKPAALTTKPTLTFHSGIAAFALLAMIAMMITGVVPVAIAAIATALLMLVTGCLKSEDAYHSMNWQSLILIAAMLPMGTALENTGGTQFVAELITNGLGASHPLIFLAGIYLVTMLFSQFISNTATTILLAPIAMQTATLLGLSPYPILMMVAAGASSAFLTPIASPVNTLVLGPGGYGFGDFAKAGAPLVLLVLVLSLILIPLFWPIQL